MIGRRLVDRYELLEKLGAGGMGVVYRARDPLLERDVAIKLVPPNRLDEEAAARFEREARLVARMDHPAIVPIHDFGREDEILFFVMPIVDGQSLKDLIDEGSLTPADTVTIGLRVVEALEHSHARGIIHRDVKPENIMVDRGANELRVRVMDFGLARPSRSRPTEQGLAGTPAYLAPEQVLGTELDPRTDLYSLGVVLYECLAGEPPWTGAVPALLYRITHHPPPSLVTRGRGIDPELEAIILRCLAKDPAARPATARELAESLDAWLEHLAPGPAGLPPGGAFADGSASTSPAILQAPRAVLPLVGREEHWHHLSQIFAETLRGECRLLLVGGEAGVGKSRFLQEISPFARSRGARVLYGRTSDLEGSFPYEGLCELVQDYFRDPAGRLSSSSASRPYSAGSSSGGRDTGELQPPGDGLPDFSDLAPDLLELFPVLSEIPELRSRPHSGTAVAEISSRDKTYVFELFARTFLRLADGAPLVLLLENLHEAEASIAVLRYLLHRLGPTPTLIVGTYRPAQVDRGHPVRSLVKSSHEDPRVESLRLENLTGEALSRFLELILGGPVGRETVARLAEATEGNPLFLRELVRSLLETGGLERGGDGLWELSGNAALAVHGLPFTLQEAVERRLERLPDEVQGVLAVAAVLGKSFDEADLAALVDSPEKLDDAVDELLGQGILREVAVARGDRRKEALGFESGLVRTVLYRSLSRRKRRALHRRYAEYLEGRAKGRLEPILPQLVHHFAAGDVPEKTICYALDQARRSLAAWSPEDALHAARVALELVDEDLVDAAESEVCAELHEVVARALRARGQHAAALPAASRAMEVYLRAGRPDRAAPAALLAARAGWQSRQVEETRRFIDRGLELARGSRGSGADFEADARGAGGATVAGVEAKILRQLLALGATVANLQGEAELARRYRIEAEALRRSAEPAAPAAEPPPCGGTLHAGLPVAIRFLDPADLESDEDSEVAATIFETLLGTDADGHLKPALCTDWECADGGRKFILSLREGIRFSDGRPVDATSVKASLEHLARRRVDAPIPALADLHGRESFLRGESGTLAGIEADDTSTPARLVFHLDHPLPIFPTLLTDPYTAIVARVPDGGGEPEAAGAPVQLLGTGAFRRRSAEGTRLTLERNPYFRGDRACIERLEFHTGLGGRRMAAALRSGEIDLGRDLPLDELDGILRDPRFRSGLLETTRKNIYFLLWNFGSPRGSSPALRRALSRRVRPRDLVWRTLGRLAQPAVCLVPPGVPGHDPGRRRRGIDRDQASDLIATSGLPLPLHLRVAAHPVLHARGLDFLQALFAEWASLGVEVELLPASMDEFLATYEKPGEVDLLIARWNGDYDDPDNYTHSLFHSKSGLLRRFYSSPAADRHLERGRQEVSSAARAVHYRRFESLLDQENAIVPLFHDMAYRLVSPRLSDVRLVRSRPYVNYATLGKTEGSLSAPEIFALASRDELHVPVGSCLETLDPDRGFSVDHLEVIANIFDTLTRLDDDAGVVPWLASSIEEGASGRRYRIKLRRDVRFHDGRLLTARDVRFSFERLLSSPESYLHFLLLPVLGGRALCDGKADELTGLEIVATDEILLELEEPLAFFPALLSHPALGIVPEGQENFRVSWREGSVGTGPFRVARLVPGEKLELERHPEYFRPHRPRVERLTFHFGWSRERVAEEFRAGRLSLASDLPPDELEALRRDPRLGAGYREAPRLATLFLGLNIHRGPFADPRRRRALIDSLDVGALVRHAGRPAIRAHGLIPPGLVGYEEVRPAVASPPVSTDPGATKLRVLISRTYAETYSVLGKKLRQALRRLGGEIDWQVIEPRELIARVQAGDADLALYRWIGDYPDPDAFAYFLLHSQNGMLSGFWGSPEIDDLCERARREGEPALRHGLYRQIEELVRRESWALPLLHEQSYRFAQPYLEDVRVRFALPELRYEEIAFRREGQASRESSEESRKRLDRVWTVK